MKTCCVMRLCQTTDEHWPSVGLLLLRLWFGGVMLIAHGWGKLFRDPGQFPDLLGIGPAMNWALCISAEVGCAALLVLGLGSRLASVPLMITMVVAAFLAHGADPFSRKELALCYLVAFAVIACAGGGRYSLDHWIGRRRCKTTSDES